MQQTALKWRECTVSAFRFSWCQKDVLNPLPPSDAVRKQRKNILEDPSSSELSTLKKYHPSWNLKFNNLGISKSLMFRILMGTIVPISLKLNFTPNTLDCYGLKRSLKKVRPKCTRSVREDCVQFHWFERSYLPIESWEISRSIRRYTSNPVRILETISGCGSFFKLVFGVIGQYGGKLRCTEPRYSPANFSTQFLRTDAIKGQRYAQVIVCARQAAENNKMCFLFSFSACTTHAVSRFL